MHVSLFLVLWCVYRLLVWSTSVYVNQLCSKLSWDIGKNPDVGWTESFILDTMTAPAYNIAYTDTHTHKGTHTHTHVNI